jgi:hypothetical protein
MKDSKFKSRAEIVRFIKRHMSTLDHFIDQGGYPLGISHSSHMLRTIEAHDLVDKCDVLVIKNGCLELKPKAAFADDLLAEYWKLRFTEARDESNKLYNLIETAHDKANS